MGSHSYSQDCPKCSGVETLMCCSDSIDPYVDGVCINCGFEYHTEETMLSLEDLNEQREQVGKKPLTKKQFEKIRKKIQ